MVSYCLAPGIRFNDCLFSEPVSLEGWTPPQFAGLFVVLAADPNWAPKAFQPLYFGEFGNATPAHAFFQDCVAVVSSAPRRSLFVALLPMPFSTTSQRWAVCQELLRGYHPTQQSDASTSAPPAALEHKVPGRRRIGFLPLTETA